MPLSRRPVVYVLGSFVVALVGLVGITTAESRPPTNGELRAECATRVHELEAEVRALRDQLRVAAACESDASSTRARSRVSSRSDLGDSASAAENRRGFLKQTDPCNPPYEFDRQGIKYFRSECLVAGEPDACSIPYAFTANGIKYFKPSCFDAAPSELGCDPPFAFDASGVKTYKAECLEKCVGTASRSAGSIENAMRSDGSAHARS